MAAQPSRSRITVTGQGSAEDYAIQAILEFNKGFKEVELTATGDDVCKLVEAILIMKERMGEALKIGMADIGSARPRGKGSSYLTVIVERLA